MAISDQRALENERLFREANEGIDRRRHELELAGRTPYLCECEDPECTELIQLTLEEYRGVRSDSRNFVVARGHPTRGDVFEEREGYLVSRKEDA